MTAKYSTTDLHKFIRSFVESEGGKVVDVCEEYFTIELPDFLNPRKYTYQPAVSREKKIELVATGSQAFEGIVRECLSKGIMSSISLKAKDGPEAYLKNFFKDSDYSCEFCEKADVGGKEISFCTKSPRCYHRINNSKIQSIRILNSGIIRLFQFYFSVLFKNRLRKNEEITKILVDEKGSVYDCDILENPGLEFIDSRETIEIKLFDKLKAVTDETLDFILKDKQNIFDMLLKKQVTNRIKSLEKRLEEEKLQRSISKKNWHFNENEWKIKKDAVLQREGESLKTQLSIKFINLLFITTEKLDFEIHLTNKSKICSSYIVGVTKSAEIECPCCERAFSNGYATEDGLYLCEDCIRQSLETGKIYSKNFNLAIDNTTNEYIEENEGFQCSVCGKLNSRFFEFRCSHDGSSVCYNCYTICAKCAKLFSIKNVERCRDSGNQYCNKHIIRCENCGNPVGIDKYKTCQALGKKVCSCTGFEKCSLCEQEYSTESLVTNKCPACNNLTVVEDRGILYPIIRYAPSYDKAKKWLIGRNKLNSIIVAKGLFSDTLFIVRDNEVVSYKKISFLNKMKGY